MTRKIKMIAALIVAVAIAATGTLAWHRIITKTNEFIGTTKDITVHDDFKPDTNTKDVYVENLGNVKLYVRVKLDEAMSLTSSTWRPTSSDWVTHTYGQSAANCGHSNAAGRPFHNFFTWTMGGQKYYMPGSPSDAGNVINNTNIYNASTPGAKLTPNAQMTTAAAFLAMTPAQQKAFIGWIYDTDGYAYWSQPLLPGEATGLLLHGVATADSLKNTNYYYAINVIVEVVDRADIPMWTDGAASVDGSGAHHNPATNDGKEVILIIVGDDDDPGVPSLTLNGVPSTVQVNQTINGPTVTSVPPASPSSLQWVSSDPTKATVAADGKITGVAVGTTTITVTAPNGLSASFTITVEPESGGGGSGTIPVKPPADSTLGYRSRAEEGLWWTAEKWDLNPPYPAPVVDQEGVIRLEDILVGTDYTGLTVTALDSNYAGNFRIGMSDFSPYLNRTNVMAILYNFIPSRGVAAGIWGADNNTKYPFTTTLRLTQGTNTVDIKVTMESHHVNVSYE